MSPCSPIASVGPDLSRRSSFSFLLSPKLRVRPRLTVHPGVPFPKTFPSLIRQLFKRLYRVYAHIYCHHYPVVIQLGLEPHLNTSFKHYVLFINEHSLASGKDFWGPLGDLVESMLRSD